MPVKADAENALRVFLVEDAVTFRERLADYLEEPGRIEMVGYADTEDAAIQYLRAEHPDVVIVDLHLKTGNGIGVIAAVRSVAPQPPPTIVVLTNYAFPEFELACRTRGADYFFDKSTQFGAVKALLESLRDAA
jgi:DNA-binding NarL/FixJ family response regulator